MDGAIVAVDILELSIFLNAPFYGESLEIILNS
jgi:hypothetical protein